MFMTPLYSVKKQTQVKIVKMDTGKITMGRLRQIGIFQGDIVRILQNSGGHVIIAKEAIRLALGKAASMKIFVEPLDE